MTTMAVRETIGMVGMVMAEMIWGKHILAWNRPGTLIIHLYLLADVVNVALI